MKPSLATQVRNLGLHERLVRAIEEIQQLLRVGAGVLPGDKADQWVRRRDLIEWGFATQPGGGMPPAPAWPDVPTGPAPSDPLPPDLTPPPPPTGVFTIGGYTSIFVVWDPIVDRRIGYFEVWRASVDDIGQAVKIGTTTGFQYIDEVQNSAQFYYWVRSVNAWDDSIVSPFNAVDGTPGETSPNASYMLDLLLGKITSSHLDAALAQDILTVQAGVDGNTVAIQQEAMARAEETEKLFARYTVKIDANGYVTGYGLAVEENDGVPTSSFIVRAGDFAVASPYGPGIEPVVPFAVQTVPTTIDGITFQPGVYMTAAVMKKAIVENFVAGLAVIDDANIKNVRAGKILADSLGVGQYIQSQNFSSGSTGWRINANGNAEFQNATMRGTVYANAGAIAGIQIFSTFLRSSNYIAGVRGFQINTNGTAEFNDATVRGHITADSVAANASIVSPKIMGGNFTGYGWPSSGGGFYLGSEGLLMGRWISGQQSQYFQVEANGNIYTPGFRIINGHMVVDQADIIDTFHIRGQAVTFPAYARFSDSRYDPYVDPWTPGDPGGGW